MQDWKRRAAKRKSDGVTKQRDLKRMITALDLLVERAIESDAYNEAETEQIVRARTALMAVRAGYVRRVRR